VMLPRAAMYSAILSRTVLTCTHNKLAVIVGKRHCSPHSRRLDMPRRSVQKSTVTTDIWPQGKKWHVQERTKPVKKITSFGKVSLLKFCIKGKVFPVHTIKAYRGSKRYCCTHLNLSTW
jgi:hypothetical protein